MIQNPCDRLNESRSWSTGTPSNEHPDSSKEMSSATKLSGEADISGSEEDENSSGGDGFVNEKIVSSMSRVVVGSNSLARRRSSESKGGARGWDVRE